MLPVDAAICRDAGVLYDDGGRLCYSKHTLHTHTHKHTRRAHVYIPNRVSQRLGARVKGRVYSLAADGDELAPLLVY